MAYAYDAVACPFCRAIMTREAQDAINEQKRGWTREQSQRLWDQGFSEPIIEIARATGIVAGWTADAFQCETYVLKCLGHGISCRYTVALEEFAAERFPVIRTLTEERVRQEFRLAVADAGCSHWADYVQLQVPAVR